MQQLALQEWGLSFEGGSFQAKKLQTLLLIGSDVFKNLNTDTIYDLNIILCIYDAEKQKLSFTLTFLKIEIQMFSNFS